MPKDLVELLEGTKPNDTAGTCPVCGCIVHLSDLRDYEAQEEHNTSGLCQACQDDNFHYYMEIDDNE